MFWRCTVKMNPRTQNFEVRAADPNVKGTSFATNPHPALQKMQLEYAWRHPEKKKKNIYWEESCFLALPTKKTPILQLGKGSGTCRPPKGDGLGNGWQESELKFMSSGCCLKTKVRPVETMRLEKATQAHVFWPKVWSRICWPVLPD